MGFIQSRKHPITRHAPASTLTAAATLATGLALALPAMATGNDAVSPTTEAQIATAKHLPGVTVEGTGAPYKVDQLSSPKFTQPLVDTPQTISIISKELIRDRAATTLTEALRNTAGVGTFFAGENGATSTGDAVFMRGFDTSGSIFVDGVRDLGTLSRDVFNIEQIEVTKGPNSTDYGRTAPSGAINMVTKQPLLGTSVSGSVGYGSSNQKRATADWNQQLAEHAALRLNVLGQNSGVPGRDEVENDRWGVAPALAFGLGTPTRLYLDYLHVKQDNVPDGGIPTIGLSGYATPDPKRPFIGTAPKVDPNHFYGTDQDRDRVVEDLFTAILQHDFSEDVALHDTLRWGRTHQDYLLTSFMANAANLLTPNPVDPATWTLARSLPTFKNQTNRIITNQLNLTANFPTGAVVHNLSSGIELTRENLNTTTLAALNGSTWPAASLYHPDSHVGNALVYGPSGGWTRGRTNTAGAYVFDTLKLGSTWRLNAGARLDHYATDFSSAVACGARGAPVCGNLPAATIVPGEDARKSGNLKSWQLSVIYKPAANGSVYANFATAAQPPGGNGLTFSSAANSADNPTLNPEKAHTTELGTKWNLLDDQLLLTAAAYRTTVANALELDPTTLHYNQVGRKRVQGIELTAVGQITPNWTVNAGFTSMHTSTTRGAVGTSTSTSSPAADGSNTLAYTPKLAFTSWTAYRLPFNLTIGGGARYLGKLKRGSDSAVGTPKYLEANWVFDAMASYPVNKHFDLQLNLYNVFNQDYAASINKSGYRYIPGIARSGMLTANFRF
ncbi:MAG: catecholate siderophore receptor Fiu [Rhodanobacter sp.]|nr:MAG: catecholate siderophore receptor Fiu [Rhodanobacter sp.]TAM13645.1 MAG: catecholate siderophore receptor Fiu [Rhodanobacter sp.]TAM35601.1 MAG: catecholate siderophore receptor Fiu [Rhodanobacter sp.]